LRANLFFLVISQKQTKLTSETSDGYGTTTGASGSYEDNEYAAQKSTAVADESGSSVTTAASDGDANKQGKSSGLSSKRKLGFFSLVTITYFLTAGGPYGLENLVGACPNPFYVLLIFITFPIFYAIPLSLVCAELATS